MENHSNSYQYSEFNEYNRFPNLDGIEAKIVEKLVNSDNKHAKNLWKLLKYNDIYALSQPDLSKEEKVALIYKDNGEMTSKRIFFQPFVNDAWQEQCCSLYIYVSRIYPFDHTRAQIGITVETVVHSKICAIAGDGDPDLNPEANPNDSDDKGNIVVVFKNRATVLLKCILALLNGLYIDGIGYVQFNARNGVFSKVEMPQWINRSYYGHATTFSVAMSGFSDTPDKGF